MSENDTNDDRDFDADYAELILELRQLAENVLERVEPALRRAAAGAEQDDWAGCSWCPVCAAMALLRGEHHDLLATFADHGVAVVTVLREAIAGMPVEPVMPAPDAPRRARRGRADDVARPGADVVKHAYQPIQVTVR